MLSRRKNHKEKLNHQEDERKHTRKFYWPIVKIIKFNEKKFQRKTFDYF